MRIWLVLVAMAVALAGCTSGSYSSGVDSDGAGQGATAAGSLAFQGTKNAGYEDSTPAFDCDGDARLEAYIQGSGDISFRVTDGDGTTVETISFTNGQQSYNRDVTGTAGDWELHVEVTSSMYYGGFSGQYWAKVYC